MTVIRKFLLDADSLIRAKRIHYGFDFCAGFWEGLLKAHEKNRVSSILPVRKELLKGKDDLSQWVKNTTPDSFFKEVEDSKVQKKFTSVTNWIMSHRQYTPPAKQHFLKGADPWLIAYASVNDFEISSYEVARPESKKDIKLPDVASEFKVSYYQPHEMLRELRVRFRLGSNSFK